MEKWGFIVDWKTFQGILTKHHCNGREWYPWPWCFEYFYQQLDKGDGFICEWRVAGRHRSEIWWQIRISPVPERQEWWMKIKYDLIEKQWVVEPNGRAVQTGCSHSVSACTASKLNLSFPFVITYRENY